MKEADGWVLGRVGLGISSRNSMLDEVERAGDEGRVSSGIKMGE